MRCIWCSEIQTEAYTWRYFLWPEQRSVICRNCQGMLMRIEEPYCPSCFRPNQAEICSDCLTWQQSPKGNALERNVSLYVYNEVMKKMVAKWKYRGDYQLGEMFHHAFSQLYHRHFKDYEVVPIPLSEERMKDRGFNQADLLASFTGEELLPIIGREESEKQSKKSRQERLHSKNPFYLRKKPPEKVVLVDDIYTTGTTLRHAGALLKENGTLDVAACTLIRG